MTMNPRAGNVFYAEVGEKRGADAVDERVGQVQHPDRHDDRDGHHYAGQQLIPKARQDAPPVAGGFDQLIAFHGLDGIQRAATL